MRSCENWALCLRVARLTSLESLWMRKQSLNTRCPSCRTTAGQVRNGLNASGSYRAKCKLCHRTYTLESRRRGHSRYKIRRIFYTYINLWSGDFIKRGLNIPVRFDRAATRGFARQVARVEKVHHQTVLNWLKKWEQSELPLEKFLRQS